LRKEFLAVGRTKMSPNDHHHHHNEDNHNNTNQSSTTKNATSSVSSSTCDETDVSNSMNDNVDNIVMSNEIAEEKTFEVSPPPPPTTTTNDDEEKQSDNNNNNNNNQRGEDAVSDHTGISSNININTTVPTTTTNPKRRNNILDIIQHMTARYGTRLMIPEWDHHNNNNNNSHSSHNNTNPSTASYHNNNDKNNYRSQNGWYGNDLIHSSWTSNVHVIDSYYVQYNHNNRHHHHNNHNHHNSTSTSSSVGTTVTGYVHFTSRAESHRGYCHGGAACSIMDDIIGWTAFCCGTTTDSGPGCCIPWSGYTVQVNTKLCKPIPIDSYLYIQGQITNIVRRKVYVTATLYDLRPNPNNNNMDMFCDDVEDHEENRIIYAMGEGIVVMNPGILPNTNDTTSTTTPSPLPHSN
jgi:acyl-coenzyme A thioesterase PaaI-like protein